MLLAQRVRVKADFSHPLFIGTAVIIISLMIHSALTPDAWAKSLLVGCYAAVFVCAMDIGSALIAIDRDGAIDKLAWAIFIAALGSVGFAALQLTHADIPFPFLVARTNNRISGNLAQANHLADLLWLGSFATAFLHCRGKLRTPLAISAALLMLAFSSLTGSRMVWLLAVFALAMGVALSTPRRPPEVRRLAKNMLWIACAFVVVAQLLQHSELISSFGISSSSNRFSDGSGEESNGQRFWIWRAGIEAAMAHPLLGVGPGHYGAFAWDFAMATPSSPSAAADPHAHNLFIQFAAELGIPVAIVVAVCICAWLVTLWKQGRTDPRSLLLLALGGVILIHSNLEYPLWYTYFLILLGVVAGMGVRHTAELAHGQRFHWNHLASVVLLVGSALAYAQYSRVERAMQIVTMQVSVGAAPQPAGELDAALAWIPPWSPYRDMREAIKLIVADPTIQTAAALSDQCERFAPLAPSAYMLSRCAVVLQVAGRTARARFFADSLCKLYPGSRHVLLDSIALVGQHEPAAGTMEASCLKRSEAPTSSPPAG